MLRRSLWSRAGRTFWSQAAEPVAEAIPPMSGTLEGQTCWVVGGAGQIGTGIVRGLLRAGATVVVNSRSGERLSALTEELGHPEHA